MHMRTHAHTYTCISSLLSGNSPASLCLFPSPLPLFYRSPNPLPILHTKKIIYQEFVQVWYLDMFGQDQVILNFSQQYPVLILPKVDP